MKVVFLTHYFPPEMGAPQTRIAELSAGLRGRGADVTVHTGFPHYPAGRVAAPYRNRPLTRERRPDGVRVVRSAVLPVANRGVARRLADHAVFAAAALAGAPAAGPADVVVAESPPLLLAAAAVPYARAKRARLVLHVADLWPDSAVELGVVREGRAVAAARRLESRAYRAADAIAVPTRGIERALAGSPAAGGKVVRLGPAVDAARFAELPETPGDGPLSVLYAGTVGLAQGVGTLLEAARLAGPAVSVTVAGDGVDSAALRAAAPANVRLLGAVPAAEVPALYAEAHAGVVLLRDRPLFAGALPTKLLECMAAGRAVVLSARGESAELVRDSGAGVVVAPEDPAALAEALVTLAGDRARARAAGRAGRAAVLAGYTRERSVDAWLELLERLASGRRTS